MKNQIQRALPLSDTYTVLGISRPGIESGTGFCCDNCGKMIVNTASIQNQKGERFTVGLDCVKTLTASLKNKAQYEEELWEFNQATRFMTLYNKATAKDDDGIFIHITYVDKKGKEQRTNTFKHSLTKFGFQL